MGRGNVVYPDPSGGNGNFSSLIFLSSKQAKGYSRDFSAGIFQIENVLQSLFCVG